MGTLNLDNKLYDLEKLSKEARAKIDSARFCDKKIAELEAELSVLRTARSAYLSVLPSLVSEEARVNSEEDKTKATESKESTTH